MVNFQVRRSGSFCTQVPISLDTQRRDNCTAVPIISSFGRNLAIWKLFQGEVVSKSLIQIYKSRWWKVVPIQIPAVTFSYFPIQSFHRMLTLGYIVSSIWGPKLWGGVREELGIRDSRQLKAQPRFPYSSQSQYKVELCQQTVFGWNYHVNQWQSISSQAAQLDTSVCRRHQVERKLMAGTRTFFRRNAIVVTSCPSRAIVDCG